MSMPLPDRDSARAAPHASHPHASASTESGEDLREELVLDVVERAQGPARPSAETRSRVLVRGLVAGLGVVVGGRLAWRVEEAVAATGGGDEAILNFALRLERVQETFYRRAAASPQVRGELGRFAGAVHRQELEHVAYLERLLGSSAAAAPTIRLGASLSSPQSFVAAAVFLEDTGVAAYNGQAANLSKSALTEVARIVSVDARHAAWIRAIAGLRPATEPIDRPRSATEVARDLSRRGFLR